jgi:pimeloyl-ACP methyl ester carboxylesterase
MSSPANPDGTGVLLLSGGVYVLNTNKNRLHVRLSRQLTALGAHVLRIDYRGVGESTGIIGEYALDDPSEKDVLAALDCLTEAGAKRIAIVGSCYGARAAMHVADHPAVWATVLLAPPVGDAGRGEVAPGGIGPVFLDRMRTLWRRGIPTMLVYGEQDAYYRDFQACATGPLASMLADDSPLTVTTLPGHLHGLQRVTAQDAFAEATVRFLTSIPGRTQ